jgi:acetoin utilization protein AcuB
MHIANWMTRNPSFITPQDTLAQAKKMMDDGHFRRLPVVENGKLEAIITERDLRQHWGYLDSTKVSAAMTSGPVTINPSVKVEDAVQLMLKYKIGGLPIVEDGKLIGILSTSDVLRALLEVLRATEVIIKE